MSHSNPQALYDYKDLNDAFPDVDPGARPFGSRVLVQIRSAKEVTSGGIYIPSETQETELWNTQVAKVISLGPVAFKDRESLQPWPEGEWCVPGSYVRVPKYGGDRWNVPYPGEKKRNVMFVIYNDLNIIGEITCNPLDVVAFV